MTEPATVIVRILGVTKDYLGLRPLRIRELEIVEGDSVALMGFDAAMAEVLVNLLTAGATPDTGEVTVFGKPTTQVMDQASWLAMLDRFGLVSERAVLLEQLTAEQNLALPISLSVESMPAELRARARQIADEVGVREPDLTTPLSQLTPPARLRVRLGRALALNPTLLLAEHPNATLSAADAQTFAADLTRMARSRGLATLVMTADRKFAHAIAARVLTLEPATGELKTSAGWRRWL